MNARKIVEGEVRFKAGDLIVAPARFAPGIYTVVESPLEGHNNVTWIKPLTGKIGDLILDRFWITSRELEKFRLATKTDIAKAAKDMLSK